MKACKGILFYYQSFCNCMFSWEKITLEEPFVVYDLSTTLKLMFTYIPRKRATKKVMWNVIMANLLF